MATVETARMTAEEFWEWCGRPENQGKRAELVRGEIVEMPPPGELHGILCWWIGYLLGMYVVRRGRGALATNDTGLIVEEGPDTVRAPDVILFGESRALDKLSRRHSTRLPELVVEVLSPTDRWTRVLRRVDQYQARGVPLVWVVDDEERSVTVFRPKEHPQLVEEDGELTGNGVLEDFRLPLAELFRLPGT
jgi:Uma2 family endonuclease